MAAKALPPQALLLQLLRYESDTGKLFWRERPISVFCPSPRAERTARTWNKRFAGKEAFTAVNTGYRYGAIGNTNYMAHRVIWKLVYGDEPSEVDHINHDRSDNRLVNLRPVGGAENHRNMRMYSHNTSGETGVSRARNKWEAYIHCDNRKVGLGFYDSFDDAVAARRAAEVKYDYHPNHGR